MNKRSWLVALGFLLPNLTGFLVFTLFPVFFSLWMAFTNWTLKPAVHFEVVGLRNFTDLMGVRALDREAPGTLYGYAVSLALIAAAAALLAWAISRRWRGVRGSGAITVATGIVLMAAGFMSAGSATVWSGIAVGLIGWALIRRGDSGWIGTGSVPGLLLVSGIAVLYVLGGPMWRTYEPTDPRFWQYFYNTLFLMIGLPFSIGGSLLLALLLNEDLPVGRPRVRVVAALLCTVGGTVTLLVTSAAGRPDAGLMGALLWFIAALGIAFNVVTFRTLFYLPSFTAGVALMILWKALYNPETGPINVGLTTLFQFLGIHAKAPQWLASVEWAKPALIMMGVWTSIGGTNMLLYLAGLSNVPAELLDAASVDGASAWHRFRHVIWPQLAPTTFFISIMAVIGGLQGGFEQARVMTGGGPAGSTTTLSYYIYNKAFQDLDMGYAAAISWVLFAIVFVATALNWKFGKGLEVDL